MNKVEIYSTDNCPWCACAKSLLQTKGLDYREVNLTTEKARVPEMIERSGRRTVPQIFINDQPIGGLDELSAMSHDGKLD